MSCPVVKAIKEITGAGIHTDEPENKLIKIGGSDSSVKYVCDSASFYFTRRKMEMARFELTKPSDAACAAKYDKLYSKVSGKKYSDIIAMVIPEAINIGYLHKQLSLATNIISDLYEFIAAKCETLAIHGKCINITILSADINYFNPKASARIYQPVAIRETVNEIVKCINGIKLCSLSKSSVQPISELAEFEAAEPTGELLRPVLINRTALEVLSMQEMEIAKYIIKVEEYHCEAISKLNEVIDLCKKYINETLIV